MTYLFRYLYEGGPPPPGMDSVDFDGALHLTAGDVAWWSVGILGHSVPLCPPTDPPKVPTIDSTIELRYPNFVPADVSSARIGLFLNKNDSAPFWFFEGMTIAARVMVSGIPVRIDSINYPIEGSTFAKAGIGAALIIDESNGEFVLGLLGFSSPWFDPDALADLFISFPAADSIQNLQIELAAFTPVQAPTNDSSLITMISRYDFDVEPLLVGHCCLFAGDANGDGRVNIADITFRIARVFAGGPPQPCDDAADANGDNRNNIADVTYMIARIFAGGPAPVCGTTGT